eukprot:CAMPEP_0181126876 /NCGR_PEP_ID=MMETSP1071-20121207/27879_1 /TAXON_ID=35127 /ORGANISM="Thalassiosira sp., Strain NH16" /LENGTH=290 /DNA_ID=CAMNT_0023212539 /DNA_START=15 /DNA_END=887 /DNA_ORIENTATION=+
MVVTPSILPSAAALLILLSTMPGSIVEASNLSITRILADDSDCGGCNDGKCIEPALSNLSNNLGQSYSAASLGGTPICDCKRTGFIGEHCDVPCSMECKNGGKCLPATEGSEYGVETCSCSKAVVDGNPYAGLACEFGATKSCMTLGSSSKHSFCTNGGDCRDIVNDNEQHRDCICEEGFEGSHCEYVAGSAPSAGAAGATDGSYGRAAGAAGATDGSYGLAPSASATSDMIVYIMIVVIAALIGMLLLAFGFRAQSRRAEAKQKEREIQAAKEELSMIPTRNQPENDII